MIKLSRKKIKIFLITLSVLALLLLAVQLSLSPLVYHQVKAKLEEKTKEKVKAGAFSLHPFSRRATVLSFELKREDGDRKKFLLTCREIEMILHGLPLFGKELHFEKALLLSPSFSLEQFKKSPKKSPFSLDMKKALRIDEMEMEGGSFLFVDSELIRPVRIEVEEIFLKIEKFNSRRYMDFFSHATGRGRVGKNGLIALEADPKNRGKHWKIHFKNLPLKPFSPYLENKFPLAFGDGDMDGTIDILEENGEVILRNQARVRDFHLLPIKKTGRIFMISNEDVVNLINKFVGTFELSFQIKIPKSRFQDDFHQSFRVILEAYWKGLLWAILEANFGRLRQITRRIPLIKNVEKAIKKPVQNLTGLLNRVFKKPEEKPSFDFKSLTADYQKSSFWQWRKVWKEKYQGKKITSLSGKVLKIQTRSLLGHHLIQCQTGKGEVFWIKRKGKKLEPPLTVGQKHLFKNLALESYYRNKKTLEPLFRW